MCSWAWKKVTAEEAKRKPTEGEEHEHWPFNLIYIYVCVACAFLGYVMVWSTCKYFWITKIELVKIETCGMRSFNFGPGWRRKSFNVACSYHSGLVLPGNKEIPGDVDNQTAFERTLWSNQTKSHPRMTMEETHLSSTISAWKESVRDRFSIAAEINNVKAERRFFRDDFSFLFCLSFTSNIWIKFQLILLLLKHTTQVFY